MRQQRPAHVLYLAAFACLLIVVACESEKIQQTSLGIQQNRFLQSLELVESAGSLLQSPAPETEQIEQAMRQMDRGLQQAYQVETSFLQQLDVLLPRLYSESFIQGVESYRIGVESASRQKQLQGLQQLETWARFWSEQKPRILQKMVELTGQQSIPAGASNG